MDTSETYIKMRLAAIPDLGMGVPPEFFGLADCTWVTNTVYIDHKGDWYHKGKCQLERQDQLQEMVTQEYPVPWVLAKRFAQTVYWTSADTAMSMEQLWLAFAMKTLYSKVWSGEKWTSCT